MANGESVDLKKNPRRLAAFGYHHASKELFATVHRLTQARVKAGSFETSAEREIIPQNRNQADPKSELEYQTAVARHEKIKSARKLLDAAIVAFSDIMSTEYTPEE